MVKYKVEFSPGKLTSFLPVKKATGITNGNNAER